MSTPSRESVSIKTIYIRNIVFGVEDSLVSTVGFLSGIAVAGVPQSTMILTGIVLIFVEAFSMGVGSFLSEDTVEEVAQDKKAMAHSRLSGMVMFVSYFIAGFIPLLPYMVSNESGSGPFVASVLLSLIALAILGAASARALHISIVKFMLRMIILGGSAIAIGVLIGRLVPA